MNKKQIIAWGDISYTVRLITSIYTNHEWQFLELIWEVWSVIIDHGMATYSNKIELCEVLFRFIAILSFCLQFRFNDWDNDWEWLFERRYPSVFAMIYEILKSINLNISNQHEILNFIYNKNYNLDIDYSSYGNYKNIYEFFEDFRHDNITLIFLVRKFREQIYELLIDNYEYEFTNFEYLLLNQKFNNEEYTDDNEYDDYEYSFDRFKTEKAFEKQQDIKRLNELEEIYELYYKNQKEYRKLYQLETLIIDQFIDESEFHHSEYWDDENKDYNLVFRQKNNMSYQIKDELKEEVLIAARKLAEYFSYPKLNKKYNINQCSEEICFEETTIERWIRATNRKKQAIFYGSPGTGKTFIAEKLAKHLISEGDGFSELVQFHPAYSYEDFIQGIRPQSEDGKLTYPLVPGRFLEFCKKAESFQDICVLIIDEINRANLAQVFGELMYLLEYRNQEIPLAGGNRFRIPENVRIIGTMNTADRSIAQIDHALRRRFAFIELRPNYDVLIKYHLNTNFAVMDLINILKQLNQAINDKNYEIGISFFLTPNLREDIEDIWKMEIEPYLEEYFFNNLEKVDEFRWDKIEKQITI
ncbi:MULTISPECIES: McrB family protein [Nostocales]|uniref:McrB family protein n=1 Tax=Nostocales TaxID=1161 RepID=UPI00029B7512|nr:MULTISPECIES: AAA family ATPase [Nostocales]AFW93023.1 putative restriction enzyme [Anabaena sp. 90]